MFAVDCAIEAGSMAGVAGAAVLLDEIQERIGVTIHPYLVDPLEMTG